MCVCACVCVCTCLITRTTPRTAVGSNRVSVSAYSNWEGGGGEGGEGR